MDLLRAIGIATVAVLMAAVGPAAWAAQCPRAELDLAFSRKKNCASGEVKIACDGEYPEVTAGAPLCCTLTGRVVTWFCDGEENSFNCARKSVFVEAKAIGVGTINVTVAIVVQSVIA